MDVDRWWPLSREEQHALEAQRCRIVESGMRLFKRCASCNLIRLCSLHGDVWRCDECTAAERQAARQREADALRERAGR